MYSKQRMWVTKLREGGFSEPFNARDNTCTVIVFRRKYLKTQQLL